MQKEFNKVKPYVYWIKNNITGIKYLGVRHYNVKLNLTANQDLGKRYFTSGLLQKEFKKNPQDFTIKLIGTFDTAEEAIQFEKKQNKKNMYNKRYANISSYPAIIHSEETKRKLSIAHMGKEISQEQRVKQSKALKGRKITGAWLEKMKIARRNRKIPPEVGRKISQSLKGKKASEKARKNMALAQMGRKHTEESKRKMSTVKKDISDETRRKMSKAQKGKKMSLEARKKMSAWQVGRKLPEETRRKLSIARRKRFIQPNSKKN